MAAQFVQCSWTHSQQLDPDSQVQVQDLGANSDHKYSHKDTTEKKKKNHIKLNESFTIR